MKLQLLDAPNNTRLSFIQTFRHAVNAAARSRTQTDFQPGDRLRQILKGQFTGEFLSLIFCFAGRASYSQSAKFKTAMSVALLSLMFSNNLML